MRCKLLLQKDFQLAQKQKQSGKGIESGKCGYNILWHEAGLADEQK